MFFVSRCNTNTLFLHLQLNVQTEMNRVYNELSSDVNELRMKQRARNVFAAGESPKRPTTITNSTDL